nr:MAG TPA: hypothetical protein [Caudoviricetes sp.]
MGAPSPGGMRLPAASSPRNCLRVIATSSTSPWSSAMPSISSRSVSAAAPPPGMGGPRTVASTSKLRTWCATPVSI